MARVEQKYSAHTKTINRFGRATSSEIHYLVFEAADEDAALSAVLAVVPQNTNNLYLESVEIVGRIPKRSDQRRLRPPACDHLRLVRCRYGRRLIPSNPPRESEASFFHFLSEIDLHSIENMLQKKDRYSYIYESIIYQKDQRSSWIF